MSKLEGHWSQLAVHRVGHHSVNKLFKKLVSYNDKAVLAAELAQSKAKLSGVYMGRSVMETCAVYEFLEGETEWRAKLEKRNKEANILNEILSTGKEANIKGKRRKRRRKTTDKDKVEASSSTIDSSGTSTDQISVQACSKQMGKVQEVLDMMSNNMDKKEKKKRKRKRKKNDNVLH